MKYFFTIATALWVFIGSTKLASAERITRMNFTNSGSCSPEEFEKVLAAFGPRAATVRRSLLRGNVTESRSLSSSSSCRGQCAGYVPNRCVHNGACTKNRNLHEDERDLQVTQMTFAQCEVDRLLINTKLDLLRLEVSSSCRKMIGMSHTRKSECFQDNILGKIYGATVWKIDGSEQTILKDRLSSTPPYFEFCKSTKFAIEAINDPCVDISLFVLTGPGYLRIHQEASPPYSMFDKDGTTLNGSTLENVGTYMLTITPDLRLNEIKTYFFTLTDC